MQKRPIILRSLLIVATVSLEYSRAISFLLAPSHARVFLLTLSLTRILILSPFLAFSLPPPSLSPFLSPSFSRVCARARSLSHFHACSLSLSSRLFARARTLSLFSSLSLSLPRACPCPTITLNCGSPPPHLPPTSHSYCRQGGTSRTGLFVIVCRALSSVCKALLSPHKAPFGCTQGSFEFMLSCFEAFKCV